MNILSNSHYRTGPSVGLSFRPSQLNLLAPVLYILAHHKIVYSYHVLKFGYMAMILFTVLGSFWLELYLKTGVLRRFKRAFLSIFPVALLFLAWDAYAISKGHWYFDKTQMLGVVGPFNIPLEEFLFFTVVPLAALMTIQAVRTVKKHWIVGDE